MLSEIQVRFDPTQSLRDTLGPKVQKPIRDTPLGVNTDNIELKNKVFRDPSSSRDLFDFDRPRSLRTQPLLETG